jgi:hypothetical protein
MRLTLMAAVVCCMALGAASAQDFVPNEVVRDLAECKMAAMRVGNWDRDRCSCPPVSNGPSIQKQSGHVCGSARG